MHFRVGFNSTFNLSLLYSLLWVFCAPFSSLCPWLCWVSFLLLFVSLWNYCSKFWFGQAELCVFTCLAGKDPLKDLPQSCAWLHLGVCPNIILIKRVVVFLHSGAFTPEFSLHEEKSCLANGSELMLGLCTVVFQSVIRQVLLLCLPPWE